MVTFLANAYFLLGLAPAVYVCSYTSISVCLLCKHWWCITIFFSDRGQLSFHAPLLSVLCHHSVLFAFCSPLLCSPQASLHAVSESRVQLFICLWREVGICLSQPHSACQGVVVSTGLLAWDRQNTIILSEEVPSLPKALGQCGCPAFSPVSTKKNCDFVTV